MLNQAGNRFLWLLMLHVFHNASQKFDSLMNRILIDDVVDVKSKEFKYSNCVAIDCCGFFHLSLVGQMVSNDRRRPNYFR